MTHSRLSPSKAVTWVNCPGSVNLSALFPDSGPSEAAAEGTASHHVASEVLLCERPAPKVGDKAPNGVILNMEMVESAWVYIDVVRRVSLRQPMRVEQHMQIPRIHPEVHGTPDCWFYSPAQRELHVFDYKYGFGIVEPYMNWQLITYAIGALELSGIDGHEDHQTTVVLHIVQPRPFHVAGAHREWRVLASDLRGHANGLRFAAEKALGPNPEVSCGKHCQYCSARHACPSLQRAVMDAADYALAARPEVLDPAAMGLEYRTLERIEALLKARKSGLAASMEALIKAGTAIPGWLLQQGNGRAAWNKPAAEIFALGDLMGLDLGAAPEAITPAAAIKAGIPKEVVQAFSETPISGTKLVASESTLASRVFRAEMPSLV